MPPPEAKKKFGTPVPPAEATHWTLQRVTTETGGTRPQTRSTKCTSAPLPDGSVPDVWPVSEFSTANVLAIWGEGKFRVDWYDKSNERLDGQLFEVAKPKTAGGTKLKGKGRPVRDPDEIDPAIYERVASAPSNGAGLGFMEVMTLLDRATERAERREEAKAQRDREFMTTMMQLVSQKGAGPSAESLDVIQQRMALQIDQAMFRLEKRLAAQEEPEPDDDPEPDDTDPPKDISEAGEKIALRVLSEIEQKTPELLMQFLPRIMSFLQGEPSAEFKSRIRAAQAAAQNGAVS